LPTRNLTKSRETGWGNGSLKVKLPPRRTVKSSPNKKRGKNRWLIGVKIRRKTKINNQERGGEPFPAIEAYDSQGRSLARAP